MFHLGIFCIRNSPTQACYLSSMMLLKICNIRFPHFLVYYSHFTSGWEVVKWKRFLSIFIFYASTPSDSILLHICFINQMKSFHASVCEFFRLTMRIRGTIGKLMNVFKGCFAMKLMWKQFVLIEKVKLDFFKDKLVVFN